MGGLSPQKTPSGDGTDLVLITVLWLRPEVVLVMSLCKVTCKFVLEALRPMAFLTKIKFCGSVLGRNEYRKILG